MTTSTTTRGPSAVVLAVDERLVPVERLVGVAEITDLFNERFAEMTLPEGSRGPIRRSHVSNWANRRDTTGFPEPLAIPAARGHLLWDVADFLRPGPDGVQHLVWTGPPGRWVRRPQDA